MIPVFNSGLLKALNKIILIKQANIIITKHNKIPPVCRKAYVEQLVNIIIMFVNSYILYIVNTHTPKQIFEDSSHNSSSDF